MNKQGKHLVEFIQAGSGRAGLLAAGLLTCALALSACNTPTKAVESAREEARAAADAQKAAAENESNVIKQESTVSRKGTNIKAIVNGQPITNYDVSRRAAFLRLRKVGGDRNAKALEEMVEQAIKTQEAAKRGTLAGDAQVDSAFANFAKSNRMSATQMARVLSQSGVPINHFKDFIRTQMSWSSTIRSKYRAETQSKSTAEAIFSLKESGSDIPEENEYILEQTIFVIPEGKSKSYLSQRRAEALAFKQGFTKCGETASRAVGLRDVTVRTLPRTLEIQLPPLWKDDLAKLDQGQVTDIKNTEKGVEFIAICSKRSVSDDNVARVVSQQNDFDKFNEAGDEVSKEYFEELKSQATIIYR